MTPADGPSGEETGARGGASAGPAGPAPSPDGAELDDALARLHERHRDAAQLLGVLAFLAPDAVPLWLVAEHPDVLPDPLADRARAGGEAVLLAAGPLVESGLAAEGDRALRIPPGVSAGVRERMSARERGQFSGSAVHLLFRAFPDRVGRAGERDRALALAPHVLSAAEHPGGGGRTSAEAVHTLARLGAFHRQEDRPERAEAALRTALDVAERGAPVEGPLRAVLADELASVLAGRGEHREAGELAVRASELAEGSLDPDSPQLPLLLSNAATTLREIGELEGAADTFRRALDAAGAAGLESTRPLEAELLAGLADVEMARGAWEEAGAAAAAAVRAAEAAHGDRHPQTARATWMLGDARRGQGKDGEAARLFRRALEIEEALHGPGHPGVGQKALGLARHLEAMGREAEAAASYRAAAEAFEESLGPESEAARAARGHLEALDDG